MLPILHLNGYKIANPTVLARITREELDQLFRGYGWTPHFVEGDDPAAMHALMASTLDRVIDEIRQIQQRRADSGARRRPRWPMIVLATPKGWTGPKVVDGQRIEGTFRAHQVPLADPRRTRRICDLLEAWLKSYRPEELFDARGALRPELSELAPGGRAPNGRQPACQRRSAAARPACCPIFAITPCRSRRPGSGRRRGYARARPVPARRDRAQRREREISGSFGPDETVSNRLDAVFEATEPAMGRRTSPDDEWLAPEGRVLEMLSEHQCQGWLEGYLLTGRHGLFNTYEAFTHIVDSMFNQHAKWLKVTRGLPWRRPIASLNYLLASHVWRQDHNGFTHQDPGFIDHAVNKKAEVVRVYLPPDANCLLERDGPLPAQPALRQHRRRRQARGAAVARHGRAVRHCAAGIGMWKWASNDEGSEPDLVMAAAGDVPTLEMLAAVSILRTELPALKIRMINVVDLMKLQPASEHPHGLSDADFDQLFTRDKPIIFAYHGYPWLIHRLTYRRTNHRNLHVRGYKEEGTITTPFDMAVLNDLDRFHLAGDAIDRLPQLGARAAYLKQRLAERLTEHRMYIREHGQDMPSIRDWRWPGVS